MNGSLTVFRLPRSHWHCTLGNFAWDAVKPAVLKKHLTQFLEETAAGQAPHLILSGRPGIGKSHLSVAAYRWMVQQVGTELATWLNVPSFCDKVKASYSNPHDPFVEYEDAKRFVVLDDLFGRELTGHESSQIVYRLLDTAYQNGAAMLITMNQSAKELANRLPPHEISRLLAKGSILPMTADEDWRLK